MAVFLWSLAIVRSRRLAVGLGWYGLMLGPVILLALFSGHLALDRHGLGFAVLVQAIWFIVAGTQLVGLNGADEHPRMRRALPWRPAGGGTR